MIKLSVITINRNNALGLKKTIESVVSQLFNNFEYIVVDGASTDESVDIIKSYSDKISYWVSEPDTGIYNAMNKGIKKANGEYLLFLNSGDILADKTVLFKVFENKITKDIATARCHVTKDGQVVWTSPLHKDITFGTLYYVGLNHQSTFIKKDLFARYGLYDESFRYNADIEFWYRTIIENNISTQSVDIITTYYNLEGVSETCKTDPIFIKEHELILSNPSFQKFLPDYEEWKLKSCIVNEYGWINSYNVLRKIIRILHKFLK